MMSDFSAPFVLKVRFYMPSADNQKKNAAHAQYIGTRSGADRSDSTLDLDQDFDVSPDTPAGHAKYAGERPGSHGLFGQAFGERPNMKDIQRELAKHEGNVWRMVLSLREDDALRLGYTDKQKWEQMLRATVMDAAGKMGIAPSNARWIAAFHEEKGHPHVHLMIWEKNPQRERGVLSKGEREDLKRVFVNEIYAEERTRLYQEKTALRDYIRDFARDEIADVSKLIQNLQLEDEDIRLQLQSLGGNEVGISPRLSDVDNRSFALRLWELSEIMPQKGRMDLGYMPQEVRTEALNLADWLLKKPQFKESVGGYLDHTEAMTKHHNQQPQAIQKAKERAYEDLQKRVAQIVLRGAGESRTQFVFRLNHRIVKKIDPILRDAASHSSFLSLDQQKKTLQTFSRILVAAGHDRESCLGILQNWNDRSRLQLDRSALEEQVDKAFTFQKDRQLWNKELVVYPKQWKEFFKQIGISESKTPKWMWSPQNGPAHTLAHSVVKNVWRGLEAERMQMEAQAKIQRKQAERDMARRTKTKYLERDEELER